MRQVIPAEVYEELPCSMVALGSALGLADEERVSELASDALKDDGYLTLDGMNKLIRAHMKVKRTMYYRRFERPTLEQFMRRFKGKAIVCLLGHYIYVDGDEYYSFFENSQDPVVKVWEV